MAAEAYSSPYSVSYLSVSQDQELSKVLSPDPGAGKNTSSNALPTVNVRNSA